MKKVKVQIDGYVSVPDDATKEQIEEAVNFQLGFGSMSVDNPIGEPDWEQIDVDVSD